MHDEKTDKKSMKKSCARSHLQIAASTPILRRALPHSDRTGDKAGCEFARSGALAEVIKLEM
jgi:hypothetical protein